jgi:mannan endo-1,4-beta-mannosidase
MPSWSARRSSRVHGLLAVLGALCLIAVTACSPSSGAFASGGNAPVGAAATTTAPPMPYDVRPWLTPKGKYFGVAVTGVPQSLAPAKAYGDLVGKQPNLLAYYAAWGDQLAVDQVTAVWNDGALPYVAWEPFTKPLAQIASGVDDHYIIEFANEVRTLQVPIAISFGHEMNGFWYPWGTESTSAADFVKAWQHIHDMFQKVGATNVIWVWSPNIVNPMPSVQLRPYYPGDGYVDWIGVVGYWAKTGAHTFSTLYGPTFTEVRTFSQKPFLIAETGSQPGSRKPADIADLFAGVVGNTDVIGFIWFNIAKESDWRVDTSADALAAFRQGAADSRFGFDVRHP